MHDALRPLHDRIAGGVFPTAAGLRTGADQPDLLESVFASDPLRLLTRAAGRSDNSRPETVQDRLDELATGLSARRSALLAVLFGSPAVLLGNAADAADAVEAWQRAAWLAEATWRATEQAGVDDRQLLEALAARLRFLVLSEPFRHPGSAEWFRPHLPIDGAESSVARTFGSGAYPELVSRARQARWSWQRCLDEFQSHPVLADAPGTALEAELDTLAFRDESRARLLAVTNRRAGPDDRGRPTGIDVALADDVLERHLLPRFRLGRVARIAAAGAGGRWLALLVAAAGIGAAGLAVVRPWVGAWTGAAAYAVLLLGVIAFGRLWATQWLLRLPAAGAVGLLLLTALAPTWWTLHRGRTAAAALVLASFGYLAIEARNHGVGALAAVARAAAVIAVGAVHAALVATLGLVAIAPAYADTGNLLGELWATGARGDQVSVLGLGAAWCLATGVFSQILWDDRPITAPLAHLRWRRGA